ncbi:hypothetical protein LXF34_09425, partial [Enterococcus faecium]|nr:hypothetical protein [Enterococcus faecium]
MLLLPLSTTVLFPSVLSATVAFVTGCSDANEDAAIFSFVDTLFPLVFSVPTGVIASLSSD